MREHMGYEGPLRQGSREIAVFRSRSAGAAVMVYHP